MRIKERYQIEIVIKKSRFICILQKTRTEEEARAFIESIRKEYRDASHVCTAYVLEENNRIQRSSDNGEPSGTAGVPMLETLKQSGLSDVTACVVRYFGGIKLGAGGLIRAYSSAVSQACKEAPKTIDVPVDVYEIRYPYDLQGSVETRLRSEGTIVEVMYDEDITVLYETENKSIAEYIRDASSGKAAVRHLRTAMAERDITSL